MCFYFMCLSIFYVGYGDGATGYENTGVCLEHTGGDWVRILTYADTQVKNIPRGRYQTVMGWFKVAPGFSMMEEGGGGWRRVEEGGER